MIENTKRLIAVDGETLMEMDLPPTEFCVDTLLPRGVVLLGGSPKIGKSWMVLDLCVRIAKGERIWNLETHSGTTLYLCLEDTLKRVQNRLACITDEVPVNAYFSIAAGTLADGLCKQICDFVKEHPDTVLVAIDTFQMIRNNVTDTSYGNDYDEIQQMKRLADELNITLLLVHHLRKLGDSDPLNKISGTTGISGAVDAVFVLDKSRRSAPDATMVCTGRDIEDRELELRHSKENCVWELISDSIKNPEQLLPEQLQKLIAVMKLEKSYCGGNTEFAELYNRHTGESISSKALKQMMNRWKYQLKQNGIRFKSYRSNGKRLIDIFFSAVESVSDDSDSSDGGTPVCVSCVPFGT